MIILASETISKRRNLPVELQCGKNHIAEKEYIWCVQHAGNGHYFSTIEETSEYIKARKFLTIKQLEKIEGIKASLLISAEYKLKELQRIEGIRNTLEYRGAKAIYEIRQQLKDDLNIPYSRDVDSLIMLHYLKEIGENLYQLVQDTQDK